MRRRTRPAQGTQGLALLARQDRDRIARLPRGLIEERMRPGLSAQAPGQDQAQGANDQPELHTPRLLRDFADGVFAEDRAGRSAEQLIRVLSVACEALGNQTDEGNRRAYRVTHRGIAAACIPAIEALRRQPQARDLVAALDEG